MQRFIKYAAIISVIPVITSASFFIINQRAIANEGMTGTDTNQDICQTLPKSILCEIKKSQERARIDFEKRQQELEDARRKNQEEELKQYLSGIKKKYGYNPYFYILKINLYGNTLTIFSRAGWVRMNIDSESGDVDAFYTVADRNFWSGATDWHDKKTVALSFTLDEKACQKLLANQNCTFSGTDKVNLGSFFKDHELVKYGTWKLTYLDDAEKNTFEFRVPLDKKPEKSNDELQPKVFRKEYCQKVPESLACLY